MWLVEGMTMRQYVAVALVVLLLMAPCASAAVKTQALEMKSGTISVTVKTHDGKVLSDAALTLIKTGVKGKVSVTTDKKGQCGLKDLKPGAYKLVVAGRAILPFSVSDKAKVSQVLVVLPEPEKYAAGAPKKAITMPTLTTFIIGSLAVAAGILLLSGGGGSSGSGGHP